MALVSFLQQLRTDGKVTVPANLLDGSAGEIDAARDVLREIHREDAAEFPGQAPALDPRAATWAAQLLLDCCQILVMREIDAETVTSRLGLSYEAPTSPAVIHSVDLTLRHLPDLFVLAKGISPGDPFVIELKRLAGDWPLSLIGIPLPDSAELDPILRHGGLRQRYVDRVIARRATDRLRHGQIRTEVEAALGLHADHFWPGYDLERQKPEKDSNHERDEESATAR